MRIIARRSDDRWGKATTELWPKSYNINMEFLAVQMVNDIVKVVSRRLVRVAPYRGGNANYSWWIKAMDDDEEKSWTKLDDWHWVSGAGYPDAGSVPILYNYAN